MLTPAPDVTFGPWAVGDEVAGPVAVPYVDEAGDAVDFTEYTIETARVRHPDGTMTEIAYGVAPDGSSLLFALPGGELFDEAGIWALDAIVAPIAYAGNVFAVGPLEFVVEATDGWTTMSQIRAHWRDAPESDLMLWRLLDVCRKQVEAWAPQPVPTPPPSNYVAAQYTQARNVWNSVKTDPSLGGIGDEALLLRPFPLDWTVKNMIRPKVAKPVVA